MLSSYRDRGPLGTQVDEIINRFVVAVGSLMRDDSRKLMIAYANKTEWRLLAAGATTRGGERITGIVYKAKLWSAHRLRFVLVY